MKVILLNHYLHCFAGILLFAASFLPFNSNDVKTIQSPIQFEEINFSILRTNKGDENLKYKFVADGLDLYLDIDIKTEACLLTVNDMNVLTDFNYFYDTDLESAIEEIKILKQSDGNDIVVVLPTFTEEFLTFQLIKFETLTNTCKNGLFEINTHEYHTVRKFYLDNEIMLIQIKDSFEISLNDFQYKNVFTEFKK